MTAPWIAGRETGAKVYDLFVLCPTVLPVTFADTDRVRTLRGIDGLSVRGWAALRTRRSSGSGTRI